MLKDTRGAISKIQTQELSKTKDSVSTTKNYERKTDGES